MSNTQQMTLEETINAEFPDLSPEDRKKIELHMLNHLDSSQREGVLNLIRSVYKTLKDKK